MSADNVSEAVLNIMESSNSLSLVDDELSTYYEPGAAVLFDPSFPWNSSQVMQGPPASTLFSGTKSLTRLLARPGSGGPPCTSAGFGQTSFGNSNRISKYLLSWNTNCYLAGTVNPTDGVTNSSVATYISRVIEDQTSFSNVVFEPSPWANESLWLMPDLMTMIAVMYSTLLPTWDNIDGYIKQLIRQSYLAAWDTYHAWFDMKAPSSMPRWMSLVSSPRPLFHGCSAG